ncbi:tetratricopeptide repeat protein [Luteibacter jiangsuensis]
MLALSVVAGSYVPGLRGGFVFDDFANLPALGSGGPIDNGPALLRYLTSGKADPTGRPVSLLSFLIDARDWPASPLPFKRTNLVIHLLNAGLLTGLLAALGDAIGLGHRESRWAALLGALIWAAHPFFASTVLYVVQREAMLCGTFTLLALLCWLRGRNLYGASAAGGTAWVVVGTGTCTILAALAKANGLLLPVLILVLASVLPKSDDGPSQRFYRLTLLLFGPMAALIAGYVLWSAFAAIGHGPIPIRGWSIAQRLLTEPTIILDYVAQLWLLKPIESSLLHDGYQVATGLFSPWYTAAAIAICITAILLAWFNRRRMPLIAAATLFFAAGHLLESTSLALELYFDHRNYIPAMLMFWPLSAALVRWRARVAASMVATAFFLTLAGLTYGNARLWGTPLEQAIVWATRHPESARAQAYAADMLASRGFSREAAQMIDRARTRFTDEPQIAFNLVDIHCATDQLTYSDIRYTAQALRTAKREPGPLLSTWFDKAIARTHLGQCPRLQVADLKALLDAASENPRINAIRGRRQDILHLRGVIALADGQSDAAAAWFDQALAEDPTPQAALSQAAELGRAGHSSLGLRHLEYFSTLPHAKQARWEDGMPWVHAAVLAHQGYWEGELSHLRASLAASIEESGR